jgi:hypothetical protein
MCSRKKNTKQLHMELIPKLKLKFCLTVADSVHVEMCGVIKTKCNLQQHKALHCIELPCE